MTAGEQQEGERLKGFLSYLGPHVAEVVIDDRKDGKPAHYEMPAAEFHRLKIREGDQFWLEVVHGTDGGPAMGRIVVHDPEVPQDQTTIATAKRSCGDCRACCTVYGVVELQKEPFTKCQHVGKRGCSIYETRPGTCRDYVCGWLGGSYGLGQTSRPDRLGVIVDRLSTSDGRLTVREVWRGAFQRRAVRELLVKLFRSGFDVQLIGFAGRALPVMRAINPEPR